jgi:hypothetical protein
VASLTTAFQQELDHTSTAIVSGWRENWCK